MRFFLRQSVVFAAFVILCSTPVLAQGTKPAPRTAKPPVKTAPAQKKPVSPAASAPAAPVAPTDIRFKSTYTNGDQVTESSTFIHEARERYELGDTILLKQHDQKRVVQISRASNTYLVSAEGAAAAAADTAAAPAPPGVVMVAVAIVDTTERKTVFGQEARHIKTTIDRQPQTGACDKSKIRIETDAWYIDQPKALASAPAEPPPAARAGCADEIKTTESGDARLLGFPISYRTTFTEPDDKDAKPTVVAMEITDFEVTKLDGTLFDIPPGMTEAANPQQLSRAVSDANEVKLAQATDTVAVREKKPGTLRVGVPEVTNKTTQTVDTRALRARLVTQLEEQKIDAIPMAAGSPSELEQRATKLGVDYLLVAEVSELKVSKPGGLTKVMKATAKEAPKDITEAKMTVQLVAPGAKPRLSKTTSGKEGGLTLKTGLGVAKFAGSMYLKFYMGGMMGGMGAMSALRMMNLGGMGNPALMELQSGLGMTRIGGVGVDRTAGAAMFVMQQAMAGAAMAGSQDGPSFDAALDDALADARNEVVDSLKKVTAVKK